ncbi:MAG: acyltransferase [Candidatus Thiodiazotropha sp.]
MKYRPEIDGLRTLAVVPVILFHAGFELFSGGFVGVDVFFVISGYLITTILIEDIENNRFSILSFYERRARRILPALYLVAASSAVVSLVILYPEYLVSFAKSLISAPIFSANFYFWSERGYFGGATEMKPLIHLWSLAVEEQFYIIFPIFLLLIRKYKSIFYGMFALAFFISIASSYYVTKLHFDTAFYFPVTRAWELLTGALASLILVNGLIVFKKSTADFISTLGLLLIAYSYVYFDEQTPFPGINALFPVIGTFLFIVAASSSLLIKKLFSFKLFVFVGLISFSLYLWHHPIFALARHLSVFKGNVLVLLGMTLLLSYLTYRYIEAPFRNKSLISARKILLFSLVGGLFLISAGIVVISSNGFPSRFSSEDRALLTQLSNYKGYNQRAFDAIQFREFNNNDKYRIVIVGDSYAKDLLNVIIESNLFSDVEFSTRQVNSECGNLYLSSYEAIEQYIPLNRLERCKVLGRYEGGDFQKILSESDEIWLASSWQKWVMEYLPQSIKNLNERYAKPIRVFGIKNFGEIAPYKLLAIPYEKRGEFTQKATDSAELDSEMLNKILGGYDLFYPLLNPLCGGNSFSCKIFTSDGLLMSSDGHHLTREGAVESAIRLNSTLIEISDSLRK